MARSLDSEVVIRRDSIAANTTLAQLDGLLGTTGLGPFMAALYGDEPTLNCPVCGWTPAQSSEEGLMGCGACYDFVFPAYQEWLKIHASGPTSESSD